MRASVFIGLLLCCLHGLSQNLSNKGKEFWVGYGHHQFMEPDGSPQNGMEMILYFSAEQTANVKVSINTTSYVRNYVVPAGTVIASQLIPKAGTFDCRLYSDPPSFGGTGGEGVFDRGIHIESDVPIVAYAHIYGSLSSGASMLMPVETWGYNYVSLNSQQVYAANCFSWMYVVAKENNTRVEITPAVPTRNGRAPGVPFQVDLQKGQIYQVVGARIAGSTGYELTGTKVVSIGNNSGQCYPIAVFAGSSRTAISCTGGSGSGDNNMQQIFPFQAWGKRYLTAPTSNSSSASSFHTNIYKIAVKDPATVVKRNGTVLTGLINNFYYQYQSSTADYIEADKPVLVAQFMSSAGGCPNTSGDGDPEMMYLSPLEQGIKRVGFYRNTREAINSNYLTLIIPTAGVSSLRIDGTSTFSHTYPHPNLAGYTVVIRRWSPSAQAQCIVQSDSAFTAITYGLGGVESYGYNAGTLINNLAAAAFIHNEPDTTVASHQFTCRNTPVEISMLVAYKPTKIVWRLSQLPNISPNTDVTDLNPAVVDSITYNGAKYYKYRLPGTYTFSQSGTFELPVQNTHPALENCNNTEEVLLPVVVKEKPRADFTYIHTGCISDTVQFNSPANSGNGYTINKWKWEFPDGTTDALQNPLKRFNSAGTLSIKLNVISNEGCVGDTSKDIIIYDKPTATFGITPDAICEGGSVMFTDTSSYGGSAPITSWYWDFGNGNTVTASNGNPQNLTYQTYGPVTVRHAVKVGNACSSDTAIKTLMVYAKPRPGFSYPAGCLPTNGVVQFTSTTAIPDAQTLSAYSWNFGDANANPGNPNTSTLANPTHIYTTYGNYDILYSVTTDKGCVKDTLVHATFNLRPVLAYAALPAVCADVAGPLSVATASVTNGVTGTGIYKGPGTNAAGNFSPAAAGAGTHTIWYVFTTSGGCTDSIPQTILVRARPAAAFSFSNGCLPVTGLVQFNNGTTISDGQLLSYSWNFNDPNATPGNPNTSTAISPAHNFKEGGYDIKLTVTTNNGCVGDTTIHANFGLRPQLSYAALTPVCESVSTPVSVAAASVTNGVTGTGIYKGPGTDAAGNFNASAAGAGTHTIWYVFTTTGGCKDSIQSSIKVHPKPLAAFTATANICQGQAATITDNSTIPSGAIQSWQWDLGNSTTATYTNSNPFTVSYSTYNIYQVKLVAVSDNNCTSDPVTHPVNVHPLPLADFELPASVCMPEGIASFRNLSSVPGNATLSYQWNFGDASPVSTAANPTHTYSSRGPFTVKLSVTSADNCRRDTTKVLSAFFDKPLAAFAVTPDTLCQGTDNVFTDLSTPAGSIRSWNWAFGDGTASSITNPVKRYTRPGAFNVKLTVTSTAGCVSDAFDKDVIVYLQPAIDAGPSVVVAQGSIVRFNATANDPTALSFNWTPAADFANPNVLQPTLVAKRDQTYTLTATGQGNCTASDVVSVKILKPVKVPNAFSPNGDGINDTWRLDNLADYPGATVHVFNRYGQVVYQAPASAPAWDGKYKGNPLPLATYYYVIDLKNGTEPMTGPVTIFR
jgi:gliding motility-associated-like protein